MKKGLIIAVVVSLVGLLSACGNNIFNEREDYIEREKMVYDLSRARYDGKKEKIYQLTPNVFLSDELKNRYVKKVDCKGKAYLDLIGIQNVKYQIVNAGVKNTIFRKIESDYGIDEEINKDVSKVGYITYDIVSSDKNGNKIVNKNKDLTFMYEEKWYVIVLDNE